MGLAKYQAKRRFDETPEPKGKAKVAKGQLRFVVQKHAATRLHYDFRLELDGVMKSWAVPKGPSLNPGDKRLAMMVEDHPIDYRTFEGIIPEGNYGAGTVMVWDEGTYHADGETDPKKSQQLLRAGLERGDLKFVVHGEKLGGSFALVKMKGRGENNWLLIKHRDEAASKADVTNKDRSVVTGRTMYQIAKQARTEGEIHTSQSKDDVLPQDVKPMLATLTATAFDRPGWIFETKWDGYRAIAEVAAGKVKLYSRNGISFVDDYPPMVAALQKLGHDVVLDGEVVVMEHGVSSFQGLQQYRKTGQGDLRYMVFDLLYLDGHDVRKFSLRDRQDLLKRLLKGQKVLNFSESTAEHGIRAFEKAVKDGWEGIIAKDASSQYQSGRRSDSWLKIKSLHRQEAVVGGYTAPRGSRKGLGALLLGVYDDAGQLHYIGHTGGGFTDSELNSLTTRLQKRTRKTSPFASPPKPNAPVTWVKPELVAEVKFQEWTADGHMRQPIYLGLREDKPASEVVREQPQQGAESGKKDEQFVSIGRRRLKLTHLDKVFWPEEGYTKGDLINYYRQIAPVVLPYLKDRPESLNRHPNGINGKNFFQKNVADQPPDWVKTVDIFSESNNTDITWLLCQDEATLAYLANLGCIELNPWHSRAKSLEKPDYCLIDLDPEDISYEAVVEAALAVKAVLDRAGVESYPKTSGATGIHICIPLNAKYDYEQSKTFAQLVVTLVNDELPKTTSLERSPAKRQQRVYLDYLQNRKGQTMAAPYCVRPRPGATVSTPLRWDEVESARPSDFTIQTIHERVASVGDLWKPVIGKGVDLRKALRKLGG